jgi:hypothetical protein
VGEEDPVTAEIIVVVAIPSPSILTPTGTDICEEMV